MIDKVSEIGLFIFSDFRFNSNVRKRRISFGFPRYGGQSATREWKEEWRMMTVVHQVSPSSYPTLHRPASIAKNVRKLSGEQSGTTS